MMTQASPQQREHDAWSGLARVAEDLSLNDLLERVVAEACRLCGARVGVIDVVDDRTDRRLGRFAAVGVEQPRSAASGRELLVDLMASRGPYRDGGLAFVGVPLEVEGTRLGNIYLLDKVGDAGFDFDDEALVGSFAFAAGALVSAALMRERARRDVRWLQATADIATTLLGPISYETAWQLIVDRARDVSGAGCAMLLLPREDGGLYVEAVAGVDAGGLLGSKVARVETLVGEVARTGEVVVVPRTDLDRRYTHFLTPGWPRLDAAQLLPMPNGDDQGVLVVGWADDHPDERDLDPELPQRFVDQAALVLQMAHIKDGQRRLAVLEDRDRISRDLHDVVIQRLYAVGLGLEQAIATSRDQRVLTAVSTAVDGIDDTILDLRRTIFGLTHGDSDSPDVRTVLQRLVDEASHLLRFQPRLTISGPVATQVSGEVRQNLIAVAGEILSNVVQHAQATAVTMDIAADADFVTLTVMDNGRGYDTEDDAQGNGLRNIGRRAELLGGMADLRSEPGQGTTIVWKVPGGGA